MNDTLKVAGRIGAELGAAKAECERLRELLRDVEFRGLLTGWEPGLIGHITAALSQQADHVRDAAQMMVPSKILKAIAWGERDDAAEAIGSLRCLLADPEGEDEIAFPDSPEPTDAFTATDMATAAAQGFRDGQAAVEQAPAQDELPAGGVTIEKDIFGTVHIKMGDFDYIQIQYQYPYTDNASQNVLAKRIAELLTRPAQTEQQPIGYLTAGDRFIRLAPGIPPRHDDTPLYAAPIAQTAPQGKFRMGDLVKKSTGSEWQGRICGTYSTALTPEGYAVESEAHAGSVQIYPAKALEAVE